MLDRSRLTLVLMLALLAVGDPAAGQAPRRGGILNAMLVETPPGFSIHESATVTGVWPDIQRKLEADVARPMLGWRNEYFTRAHYVHNLVPHNSLYQLRPHAGGLARQVTAVLGR